MRQPASCVCCERYPGFMEGTKLAQVARNLFQVISNDFLEYGGSLPRHRLEPPGEPLVHVGSFAAQKRVVRRVANEYVVEAERVITERGRVRLDELPTHQHPE